jgi:hypothetical protein
MEPALQNGPVTTDSNNKSLCSTKEMTFYTLKTRIGGKDQLVSCILLTELVDIPKPARPSTLTLKAIERLYFGAYDQSVKEDVSLIGVEICRP